MGRIPDLDEFYYNNRYCPECGGYQKNCEHFWAGHVVGKQFGVMLENERILKLLQHPGKTHSEVTRCYYCEVIAIIKAEIE